MQDEVLKHTEKIYKIAKNSEHSIWKRVKEILIEIFIIVFAVTLSIWFHNWSEHENQRAEAKDFLIPTTTKTSRHFSSTKNNRK